MSAAWTPETWRQVKSIGGKVADEEDFSTGVAVFYQRGNPVEAIEMTLPHPAIAELDGETIAVVIVQAERTLKADETFDTFGAIDAAGRHLVFSAAEHRLVQETDPQWIELARAIQ